MFDALMVLPTVRMKRSHSEFELGQRGIILRCLIPMLSINILKSDPFMGGPLSDLRVPGTPNMENNLSSTGMTDLEDIDVRISTNGNLEYSSITTSKYLPSGKGPQKSKLTS